MNRAIALVIAAVVLVALGVGVIYPALTPKNTASVTAVFYDADGKTVYSASSDASFWNWFDSSFTTPSGAVVSKVRITIGYSTETTGTATGLSVTAKLDTTVRLNTITAGVVNTATKTLAAKTTQSGTFDVIEYNLADLITPIDDAGKTNGWSIEFKVTITALATVDGESASDTWTEAVSVSVKWLAPGLTVTGTIGATNV